MSDLLSSSSAGGDEAAFVPSTALVTCTNEGEGDENSTPLLLSEGVEVEKSLPSLLSDLLLTSSAAGDDTVVAGHDEDESSLKSDADSHNGEDVGEGSMRLSYQLSSPLSNSLEEGTELPNSNMKTNKNIVLVSHDERTLCYLVEEAGCKGVLDSGCAKSVTGLGWIGRYTSAVSPQFSQQLVLSPSSEVYQFGGGQKRTSKGSVSIPALIGELRVFIKMDVVDAEIPLLIGTNSMKVGKALLNFATNEATFFGETVPMVEVGSGHFCIELVSDNLLTHIDDVDERDQKVQETLVATKKLKVSDLRKLHHYYGHTHPNKLLKFLKNAGRETDDFREALIKIENTCESCNRSKRRIPRPKCSIPRVEGPNEILSIDLKEWTMKGKKQYICYLIDMFSRLTSGSFIRNKNPDTIVDCILLNWVKHYGLMKSIHSDIGGEFSNNLMEEVANKLGVELTTTAAYSPQQNGINERNHAVVDMMVTRMLASDKHLPPHIALAWALNAKNSLENQHGFSPFQLHIGTNPTLPSTTRDGPPSFEDSCSSSSFVKHVNAMMNARKQFIDAESSASLKKALKSKLYTRGDDIQEKDLIYYKKSEGKGKNVLWRGPSRVAAVNGKKLFIDQGARLGTVNRDDAVRVGEEFWRMDDQVEDMEEVIEKKKRGKKKDNIKVNETCSGKRKNGRVSVQLKEVDLISSLSSSSSADEGTAENLELGDGNDVQGSQESVSEGSGHSESEENISLATSHAEDSNGDEVLDDNEHRNDGEVLDEDEQGNNEEALDEDDGDTEYEDAPESTSSTISFTDVRQGDTLSYIIPETSMPEVCTVISRAGRVTGSNKYWWNVQVKDTNEKKSLNTQVLQNLQKVSTLPATVSTTLVVMIPRYLHSNPECVEAKEKELQNWRDFNAFIEVKDVGQATINTNWVLVRKSSGVKARLCIRGDKEPGKDLIQTDSPTVNKINVKLFYVIASSFHWTVCTADIRAAFLQGAEIDRDVYVRPPKECRKQGVIWKMVKRAYGFVDAGRGFYIELDRVLLNLGCKVSRYDPALYMYFGVDNSLQGMLLTHVDDFLHGSGSDDFVANVINPLKETFQFGSEDDIEFVYVGLHVVQRDNEITIDQDRYIDNLEIPDLTPYSEDVSSVLDENGQSEFRGAVGRIGWVANSTRPDMAYDNLVLSTKLGKATVNDMRQVCRMMKKMKCDGAHVKFIDLGPVNQWVLQGYGDSGYKSLPDKVSSSSGQVVLLSNPGREVACVIEWKSRKLRRVVSSSTAAEALAANDSLDLMVYIQSVLGELLGQKGHDIPLVLMTDSKNLHDAVMSSGLVDNPRLRTQVAVLKESLQSRELNKLVHVSGKRMIADVLTKKGAAGFPLMNILRTCKMPMKN